MLAIVTGLAVATGARYRDRWADEAAAQRWLELDGRREHLALLAAQDPSATTPIFLDGKLALAPAPLADLVVGRSDLEPRRAEVSAFVRDDRLFRDYQTANPAALRAGRFDLGFVIVYVVPLIIIVLGYGLLSDERERGLDRLLALQGVSLARLAIGRVVVRALVVAAPLVVGMAALVAAEPTADRLVRAAAALAAATGYAACWWSVVLLVGATRLRSGPSLLALLTTWVSLVMLVPSVIGAMARTLHPPPSRFTLIADARAAEAAAVARAQELIDGYTHDHLALDPKAMAAAPLFARRGFIVAREVDRAIQPTLATFDAALAGQRRAVERWQYLSPSLTVYRALTTLAGTDERRALAFRTQASAFADAWRERLGQLGMRGQVVDEAMVAAQPYFELDEPTLRGALRAAAVPIGALWALAAVGALLALRRLRAPTQPRGKETS